MTTTTSKTRNVNMILEAISEKDDVLLQSILSDLKGEYAVQYVLEAVMQNPRLAADTASSVLDLLGRF